MKTVKQQNSNRLTGALASGIVLLLAVLAFSQTAQASAGKAVWRQSGSTAPVYNIWDGSSFGTPMKTVEVGSYRIIAGAEAPTRDEIIVVGVDGAGVITGEMWDGNSWTAPATITTPYSGEPKHMHLASNPKADEMILVVSNSSSQDNALKDPGVVSVRLIKNDKKNGEAS